MSARKAREAAINAAAKKIGLEEINKRIDEAAERGDVFIEIKFDQIDHTLRSAVIERFINHLNPPYSEEEDRFRIARNSSNVSNVEQSCWDKIVIRW